MRRRFATLDVFTQRRFAGNPLAVVLEAEGLEADVMQAIAREFNHPETVFVFAPADAGHRARVRIFTPVQELPFAGHPTVGTAVLLALCDDAVVGSDLVLEEGLGAVRCTLESAARAAGPALRFRNCRARSGRPWTPLPLRRRCRLSRATSSAGPRGGRPASPSPLFRSGALLRWRVAVPIPRNSILPSPSAQPTCFAARPPSPGTIFARACSRPAWGSRKIQPPDRWPRRVRRAPRFATGRWGAHGRDRAGL
jgi:Phenazine biosynthesis-like protein